MDTFLLETGKKEYTASFMDAADNDFYFSYNFYT